MKKPFLTGTFSILTSLVLMTSAVWSAEQITVTMQGTAHTLNVRDIENFLQTGATPAPVPDFVRENPLLRLLFLQLLHQEFSISELPTTALNPLLSGISQEVLLNQTAQIVRPSGGTDSRTALRTALAGAIQNNRFNPLRFIRSFPDREIIIDGDRLRELQKLLFPTAK